MRASATASSVPYGKSIAVGWRSPHGPAVALLQRGYSKEDDSSLFPGREIGGSSVGAPGHIAWSDAPQLFMTGNVLRCLFHDDEGVYVASLTSEGVASTSDVPLRLLRDRERIAAPTRSLTMSTEGQGCAFALADPDGVRVGRISSRGEPTVEKERWLTQVGATPHVALGEFLGRPLIATVRPGERELVIARREGDRVETVKHELSEPALDVALDVAGSKGCLAVLSMSGHRIDTTMLDGQGRMTGRMAMLIEDTQLRMTGIQVLWVEDGFRVFGYDESASVMVGFRIKDGRREVQIGDIERRPQVSCRQKKIELFSADADAIGGAMIHVVRAALDGTGLVRSPLPVRAPRALLLQQYERDAREFLGAVSRVFLGEGYRGSEGQHIEKGEHSVAIDLTQQQQRIELRVRQGETPTYLLRVRTGDAEGAQPVLAAEQVDDTFARLAGWLRGTFSKDSRMLASREAAWATRIANELVDETKLVSARVLAATKTGAILEVEIVAGFPDGKVLAGFPNGKVLAGFPNGKVLAGFPNGQVLAGFPNGKVLAGFADGKAKALPDADAFARWLRRVLEELRAGMHRLEETPSR